jgi:hypothetical protein
MLIKNTPRADRCAGASRIKPDGHRAKPPRRLTRKGKECALCDLGHQPDGPRGHHIDGKWITCRNQSQQAGEAHPETGPHYDRAARGRKSKPKMPPQAAIVPAAFIPEQRIVRPA